MFGVHWWFSGKESPGNTGDTGDVSLIPGWWISPAGGHGNPPQCSCLENRMDRGACEATVHRITESRTRWERLSTLPCSFCHGPTDYVASLLIRLCYMLVASVMSDSVWPPCLQASLFMEFSRQEYWSGLLFPFSGDLPNPGIGLGSPVLQADSLPSEPPGRPIPAEDTFK